MHILHLLKKYFILKNYIKVKKTNTTATNHSVLLFFPCSLSRMEDSPNAPELWLTISSISGAQFTWNSGWFTWKCANVVLSLPQGSQQSQGSCAWRNLRGCSQKGREIHQNWGKVLCTLKEGEALHDKQGLLGGVGWNRGGMDLLPGVLGGIILLPGQMEQQETLTWACCAQGNTQPWALEPVIGNFTALMGIGYRVWNCGLQGGKKLKQNPQTINQQQQ